MTSAFDIQYCRGCLPAGWRVAYGTMEAILRGERDAERWLCPGHREKMDAALTEVQDDR